MNLKNYTSSVPVDRTVSRIEQALAAAGVKGIAKEYVGGQLVSLYFRVARDTPNPPGARAKSRQR
jgi:hypothetical protein